MSALPNIITERYLDPRDTDADFYACLLPVGDGTFEWFDSARLFQTAVHWCAMYAGETNLDPEDELRWMDYEGAKRGYSVVHSSVLIRLAELDLII